MTRAAFEQVLERLQANPVLPSFALMHELGHAQLQLWRRMGGKVAKPIKQPRKRKLNVPENVAPELLTLDQAATYLNITADQVAAFVQDGALDYINLGRGKKKRRIRFTKQDLDAFIEHRRQREVQCLSTGPSSRRSTPSTSGTVVSDFLGLRAAQLARKPKPSKQ